MYNVFIIIEIQYTINTIPPAMLISRNFVFDVQLVLASFPPSNFLGRQILLYRVGDPKNLD